MIGDHLELCRVLLIGQAHGDKPLVLAARSRPVGRLEQDWGRMLQIREHAINRIAQPSRGTSASAHARQATRRRAPRDQQQGPSGVACPA